jgi:murein DD-endopeptidase MepM/ murein hydrolase activator NlpD
LAVGFGMRTHPILLMQRMHTGVDYAAEAGTPVHASASGEVVFAARDGAYGKRVVIAHGNHTETAYAHLLRIDVRAGDCVAQGAKIGSVGATGLSVRNQLHFEVLRNGRFIDPTIALGQRDR